jgi:rare lipoprotein A (peptidoglycan hydrolase)
MQNHNSLLPRFLQGLVLVAMAGLVVWLAMSKLEQQYAEEDEAAVRNDTLAIITAVASWYGKPYHGRLTANGEVYDMHKLTFAHKTMPFGTVVKFWRDDKSVTGRCTDRGPFIAGRTFDLSYAMACSLGMVGKGVDAVQFEIIK